MPGMRTELGLCIFHLDNFASLSVHNSIKTGVDKYSKEKAKFTANCQKHRYNKIVRIVVQYAKEKERERPESNARNQNVEHSIFIL